MSKQFTTVGRQESPGINVNWKLVDAVSEHTYLPTPYMLTDLDVAVKNCKRFTKSLPEVQLYFAVKAYYSKEIIHSVLPHVSGFDVASPKEIDDLISFGVDPATIMYSNPVKSIDAIKKAYSYGIRNFAFQSLAELTKLQINAPGANVYARVKLHDSNSFVPLSEKFGCSQSEVISLFTYARHAGLKPVGVTFHVGSQLLDHLAWQDAIAEANHIMQDVRAAGIKVNKINIGGGFPTQYFTDDTPFEKVTQYINQSIKEHPGSEYLAEPGRFIMADTSVIVSRIIGVEQRNNKNWLFLDTGLYQSFIGSMNYDVFPYVPVSLSHHRRGEGINKKLIPYVLTGPSCDSNDIISHEIMLPSDLSLDDILIFPNTGAYTLSYGSNFNGFTVPRSYYLKNTELV